MIKALIKNQFAQLFPTLFVSRKGGQKKSLGGTILTLLLFAVAMVSLTFFLFTVGLGFTSILHINGMEWVYYAVMGIMTLIWGIFGSIFTTYVALYKGKDNEILLPLPISFTTIVSVRLIMVFLMSLLYGGMGWVATILAALMDGTFSFLSIPMIVFLTFFISFFTTFFGFVIAVLARKIKNKTIMTIVVWILFFGLYYAFVLNLQSVFSSVLSNVNVIAQGLSKYAYVLVLMAKGASGELWAFLIFAVISVALFVASVLVISKTFMWVVGASDATSKKKYKGNNVKTLSVSETLYKREMKRFLSNATYMLNCGLGLIILALGAVVLLVKGDLVINYLNENLIIEKGLMHSFVIIIVTTIVLSINSLNDISAPSVSLEGKTLWILKSIPVDMGRVLMSKLSFHVRINGIFSILFLMAFNIAYAPEISEIILMIIMTFVHIVFVGEFGLFMNLLRPNLDWLNEAIPVKQSMSVFVTLIGSGMISVIYVFGYIIPVMMFRIYISPAIYTIVFVVLEGALDLLLYFWLKTFGKNILEKL